MIGAKWRQFHPLTEQTCRRRDTATFFEFCWTTFINFSD